MDFSLLHQRALAVAGEIRNFEWELIDLLQEIEACRGFTDLGYASLFVYVTTELRLTEDCAYKFITVSRKAREVPELLAAVAGGEVTVSIAKVIVPVITRENHQHWLERARTLSKRELEREVANANPERARRERARPIGNKMVRLELDVSEETHALVLRAQELLTQKTSQSVGIAETLHALAQAFVKREDPVEKADRNAQNTGPGASKRHKVHRRDRGRCQFLHANGSTCGQRRWLHIHHKKPKAEGGTDDPDNLITLCAAHHRLVHEKGVPLH